MTTVNNKTRPFDVSFLLNMLFYDEAPDGTRKVYDKITGVSRWSVHHELVFEHEGKFYRTVYSEGATEMQDESPWEYEGPTINCVEVTPVQEVVTVYRAVRVVED